MSMFTALHRALGLLPGPLTSAMVDAAVAQGVAETTDLDFKKELPPTSNLPQTDFPKDVAAMANSGGGTIVYGVVEDQKRATGRHDVGELTENHERTLRAAAVSAIVPPVFGLQIDQVGEPGDRCVTVAVPATLEGPHLIFRHEFFGAPVRNDADTVWMNERQIEAMYRARFDRRRDATETLERLYGQTEIGCDSTVRAWFVAAGTPRLPAVRTTRLPREEARTCFRQAEGFALQLAVRGAGIHPLEEMDRLNPRPGLRCWIAYATVADTMKWKEARASVGDHGAITLAAALGGHRYSYHDYWPSNCVEASGLECAVADFLGLLRTVSSQLGSTEYDVQIGIAWAGNEALQVVVKDPVGLPSAPRGPVHFVPVQATIAADASDEEFHRQAHELALDCVNQAGIAYTTAVMEQPK